ncbi:hypothetical protein MMPV_008092 [Pyropia vietnamensis]
MAQQAYDYAEEPANAGQSTDSLLEDLREASDAWDAAAALVPGTPKEPAWTTKPESLSPSTSLQSATAPWSTRWVPPGGTPKGGTGAAGLPAALRRAAGLVRGRSTRSLWAVRH